MHARCVLAQPYSMASLGGKKPKLVHEREWEKLLSGQIPCTSIKSVDETIRFRSDRGKSYFHLTYNPVGHSKSKRLTVEDPDGSYVLGTRQRLLASPLFKQQGSAQDQQPPPPPPPQLHNQIILMIRYRDTSVHSNCILPGRYAPLTYYEDPRSQS